MDNNERAIQIRAAKAYPILSDIAPENDLKNEQFLAYIKGATEQKKIDIEKACKVYADLLSAQGYNPIDVNAEVVRMKKAMEE